MSNRDPNDQPEPGKNLESENFKQVVIEPIAKYEDKILDNKESLRAAIERGTSNSDMRYYLDDISRAMELVLYQELSEQERQDVSSAIINYLAGVGTENIELLREEEVSEDLQSFLTDMGIEHGPKLSQLGNRDRQGNNFWSSVETDLVVRPTNDEPGFAHRIIIGYEDEVQIDTDIDSNLRLARYLIRQQARAINALGQQATSRMDPEVVEDTLQGLGQIRNEVVQFHQNEGNNPNQ